MMNGDFGRVTNEYLGFLTEVKGLSPFTENTYRADIRSLFQFFDVADVTSIAKFDRECVRTYLAWLTNLGYERASVVRKLSVIRGLFRWLLKEGFVEEDPVPRYSVMRKESKLPNFLSIEEVERIFIAIEDDNCSEYLKLRDIAMFELFYSTGIRVREMSGLDVSNVDIEFMRAKVLGKGSRERMVIFGIPAKKAVLRYLDNGRPQILSNGEEPALFLSQRGNRLSVRSIQSRARKYSRLAGLGKDVHPHMIRHSFATHMIEGGANLRVVQDLLGHASPVTTQTYLHVTGARAKESYMIAHPFGKD